MPPLVDPTSVLLALVSLLGGVLLLVLCVEKVMEGLVSVAADLGVSPLLLAVLVACVDLGDWGFGLAAVLGGSPEVAVGAAFGAAYFLLGAALPAAALVSPFELRVRGRLLAPAAVAPAALYPFLLDGRLALWEGGALWALFAAGVAWMHRLELAGGGASPDALGDDVGPDDLPDGPATGRGAREGREGSGGGGPEGEPESGPESGEAAAERGDTARRAGAAALFLGGAAAGSALAAKGAGGMVSGLGLDGTAFGATFVGLVLSLGDALVVLVPVRRGRPAVAAGAVVGSLLFVATGDLGLLALAGGAGGLELAPGVASLHGPALAAGSAVACLFLWQGKMSRSRGTALLLLYLGMWIAAWGRAAAAG